MEEEDITKNFSIEKYKDIVTKAFNPQFQDHRKYQTLLIQFKDSQNSWLHIDSILTQCDDSNAQYIALQILEQTIKTRWNTFPMDQKLLLRNYIVQQIINRAKEGSNANVLEKFNISLVEILKRDWPRHWNSFISDIVNASNCSGMEVCANSLCILKRLNEEIFIFSEITTVRKRLLINQLKSEFVFIYNLIVNVLEWSKTSSVTDKLMNSIFSAVESFSIWMPISFFCENSILEHVSFYINSRYSLSAIKCLTKIVDKRNKKDENEKDLVLFEEKIIILHKEVINFLVLYFNKFTDNRIHDIYDSMDNNEKDFIASVSMLLIAFYEKINELEKRDIENVKKGLRFLIAMCRIDDDKIYKDIIDLFKKFTCDLYSEYPTSRSLKNVMNQSHHNNLKREKYESILKGLIELIICKMPRPEEVFITENEYGEIVKEKMIESEKIEFYKTMKETFFYLAFLNKDFTIKNIYEKISSLFRGEGFSYDLMNRVCWSAGCVAGAFDEKEESDFFVYCLKELLTLCEIKYSKPDKAVIASNIMFLIGQFDRFLMANNKFLKTVVKKLFEFMSEAHEGIKDMACDTFLKVSIKCSKIFITQMEQNENYMLYITRNLKHETSDLEFYQKRIVYEAFCICLLSVPEKHRMSYVDLLSGCFSCDLFTFNTKETFNAVCHCLRSYSIIFENINEAINSNSMFFESLFELFLKCQMQSEKNSNTVKIEIVRLLTTVVKQGNKVDLNVEIINSIFGKVLIDYKNKNESVYLILASEIVKNVKMENTIQRDTFIVSKLLEISQGKIGNNDEQSRCYFSLILSLIDCSFETIFPVLMSNLSLLDHVFKNVIDGLSLEKEINDNCLDILEKTILKCYELRIFIFFQRYILVIIENLLGTLFDKDKSFSLEKQCSLFCTIMKIMTDKNMMQLDEKNDNVNLLSNYVKRLIQSNFSNITEESLGIFLMGLFVLNDNVDVFKDHVCDFRIKIYEFYGNEDLEDEIKLQEERKNEILKIKNN
ncbi:Exportin-1 [Gurleya vavrai]